MTSSRPIVRSSTHAYRGKIVSVRTDEIELEDGHLSRQEVVEHRQSMTVIAIDSQERIVLVRQYRHPAEDALLETPAGSIDPGESPAECANRELAEECGFQGREVVPLGQFYLAPGWTNEFMHAFLIRDLYEVHAEGDEDERIEVVLLTRAEWEAKIRAGEIRDCKSIAAWYLALPHL